MDYFVVNSVIARKAPVIYSSDFISSYGVTEDFEFIYSGDGKVSFKSADASVLQVWKKSEEAYSDVLDGHKVILTIRSSMAGTGQVQVHFDLGENYMTYDAVINVRINAAPIEFTARSVSVDYTGDPVGDADITVTGPAQYVIHYSKKELGWGIVNDDYQTTPDLYIDTGVYTIYFAILASNYRSVYGSYVLTINRVPHTITVVAIDPFYTGMEQELLSAEGNFTTLWFSLNGGNWLSTIPKATMPGTYSVRWYAGGSKNYYGEASQEDPYIIEARILRIPFDAPDIDDVTMSVNDGPYIIHAETPSDGTITYFFEDPFVCSVEISGKTVAIIPNQVGRTLVFLRQREGTIYAEHLFVFQVTVTDD